MSMMAAAKEKRVNPDRLKTWVRMVPIIRELKSPRAMAPKASTMLSFDKNSTPPGKAGFFHYKTPSI
jgi:hypothetical protein